MYVSSKIANIKESRKHERMKPRKKTSKLNHHDAAVAGVGDVRARLAVVGDAPRRKELAGLAAGRAVPPQQSSREIELRHSPRAVFRDEQLAFAVGGDVIRII